MSESLLTERQGAVLLLTLNRPSKKNAFDRGLWLAFSDTLTAANEDPGIACVVITGAGADFSAGVDLSDFGGGPEGEEQPFYKAQRALVGFDKPLIGAAKGVAVGGGATMLFHCDIVYVGESLRMRLPFVNLGLVPEFASSYTLQANIGAKAAAELMYTAEWIDADRAVETTIATRKYADDQLLAVALEKAQEIAQWPVKALQETKKCMKSVHQAGLKIAMDIEAEGMEKMAGSPENIEAITAFMEKRKPDFSNLK